MSSLCTYATPAKRSCCSYFIPMKGPRCVLTQAKHMGFWGFYPRSPQNSFRSHVSKESPSLWHHPYDDTTLMAESKEELKSLHEGERGELKSWLKTQHSENKDHGIWSYHFMANRWENSGRLFSWAPKSLKMVTAAIKLKDTYSWE